MSTVRSSPKSWFWLETALLVCAIAFLLAVMIAGVGAAAAAVSGSVQVSAATPLKTYEGVITDTKCGAKHSAAIDKTAADCSRACVHGGEQFALVDGEVLYSLDGKMADLKPLAGQRVKIVGVLNGNKLSVTSVVGIT